MPVDVLTEVIIARPRARVSAYAADPSNATMALERASKPE